MNVINWFWFPRPSQNTVPFIPNIGLVSIILGFPGGSDSKESACKAEDPGSIPGSGRSPGEGNVNPLQYSPLETPMDRSQVGYSPWGHKSQTLNQQKISVKERPGSLSLFLFMHWRRKWQPTPVFLPGESQGWGSLVGRRLWGHTESDTTEAT